MRTTQDTPVGYAVSRDQVLRRLARIEGQVRGVTKMVEQDRYCIDVLTQVCAIQAALDKVSLGLLDGHARVCMSSGADATQGHVDELMGAVGRMLRR